ncbi:VOC family protein [Romeria aff. gracilis LEGE 07310]|uniref:VOC family protein n=1 Tax=Vasconcelosia minhoensis LEGE 07310 TaxID=915328 RepID=A0A8J7DB67_9CYAN|nr:VOC family protein [Romeria gracilis]MBE9077302.1 VOC family protein [Romeria aff. gracilis LEGE 07310]
MQNTIFHAAFPITNLEDTKHFYIDGLGCEAGRQGPGSLILNFQGHQLVAHLTHEPLTPQRGIYPRHFGITFLEESDWEALLERAQERGLTFYQQPRLRFEGTRIEHRTFFLEDPFHNLLEFKFYRHASAIFGETQFSKVGDTVAV